MSPCGQTNLAWMYIALMQCAYTISRKAVKHLRIMKKDKNDPESRLDETWWRSIKFTRTSRSTRSQYPLIGLGRNDRIGTITSTAPLILTRRSTHIRPSMNSTLQHQTNSMIKQLAKIPGTLLDCHGWPGVFGFCAGAGWIQHSNSQLLNWLQIRGFF